MANFVKNDIAPPSRLAAIALFASIVIAWGITWTVAKLIVMEVPPFWMSAIRSLVATIGLGALLLVRGQMIIPKRGDLPVIVMISIPHMIVFSVLMSFGLMYVSVGRSVVLAYTTPLWVALGAWPFLRERIPPARAAGIALGLAGLAFLFNPLAFDWSNRDALFGNAMLLLSALSWSVSILYTRAHKWISSPFQLVFWQALLATLVLFVLAPLIEGAPGFAFSWHLALLFAYTGLVGTAYAFWALAIVNRSLPASTTALGILATPVVGIAGSAVFLGEGIDLPLLVAAAMILSGIAIGTIRR
jgi:drug/metabolite transporter (DMT)-like permease